MRSERYAVQAPRSALALIWATAFLAIAAPQALQGQVLRQGTCDLSGVPGVVWWGTEREMTLQRLAEYAAPIYWFSPDEPTMNDREGKGILVPEALPFEAAPTGPVVYYQYNKILTRADRDGPGFALDPVNKGNSTVDLHNLAGMALKYIAYFPREEGLGGHDHDVEPAEFMIGVVRSDGVLLRDYPDIQCAETNYALKVIRVTGEAHGLEWYFNVLEPDEYTRFPMTLLVEEGKHGICTDKNGDGYYTPGFDVSERVNDAWGVRDIIRGGMLFTGGYEAWMAKVRRDEHRVFPPLPDDSYLRAPYEEDGEYSPENAIYELRPFPSSDEAGDDELLIEKMGEKEKRDWPEEDEVSTLAQFETWWDTGLALKSYALSVRADGDLGVSLVFPLFLVKNVEDPMTGGFLVHRMYVKDRGLRDIGWMLMYTPSASRWIDTYLAAGVEWDREPIPEEEGGGRTTETDFVFETGIKFRVNITKSPLKFLSFLTEFMGFRAGIKNKGFFDIDKLTYVLEFGAGVW